MTDGTCFLCGDPYTKRGMTRHLRACKDDHAAAPGERTHHLRVEAADGTGDYWLHLGVEADATLADVDEFLRAIWLECCGHLSAFEVGGDYYERPHEEDVTPVGYTTRSMAVPIGEVVGSGDELDYQYDFGTTTELSVRVVDVGPHHVGPTPPEFDSVGVYARNHSPGIPCEVCEAPATSVCADHLRVPGGDAWLCADCADDHGCDERMFLPVVDSPRTGRCGFTGARLTDWKPA